MVSEDTVRNVLKEVVDPELGLDIVNLGLIYRVDVMEEGKMVDIDMTLTTPACPVGPHIIQQAREKVLSLREEHPELEDVQINMVWSPFWNASMMSEEAREQLGFF
jgi:metal-sulfur cluster biosynthetic enzyme